MSKLEVDKRVEVLLDSIFNIRPIGACRLIRESAYALAAEVYEECARIAEAPILGNGHSVETRAKSELAVAIGRKIRNLKRELTGEPKRVRRLS